MIICYKSGVHEKLYFKAARRCMNYPGCYQQQVQKLFSVTVCSCIIVFGKGHVHLSEGSIEAEKHTKILK